MSQPPVRDQNSFEKRKICRMFWNGKICILMKKFCWIYSFGPIFLLHIEKLYKKKGLTYSLLNFLNDTKTLIGGICICIERNIIRVATRFFIPSTNAHILPVLEKCQFIPLICRLDIFVASRAGALRVSTTSSGSPSWQQMTQSPAHSTRSAGTSGRSLGMQKI